jgi:histidine transport system permease protein
MTQLVQQYWQQYLWGTLAHPSGLIVTLWLTIASLSIGFVLAVPLAMAKASPVRWLSIPVSIYTYVVRGTPLYVHLLFLYTGVYSLDFVRSTPYMNSFIRDAFNCTLLAYALNNAANTTEII